MDLTSKEFLDDVLEHNIKYVREMIEEEGHLDGLIAAYSKEDKGANIIPMFFNTPHEKEVFIATVKAFMGVYDVQHYVQISEGWMSTNVTNEMVNSGNWIPPRDDPKRLEVVMVLSIGRQSRQQVTFEIKRDKEKPYLVEHSRLEGKHTDGTWQVQGTFADLLAPEHLPKIAPHLRKQAMESFSNMIGTQTKLVEVEPPIVH